MKEGPEEPVPRSPTHVVRVLSQRLGTSTQTELPDVRSTLRQHNTAPATSLVATLRIASLTSQAGQTTQPIPTAATIAKCTGPPVIRPIGT